MPPDHTPSAAYTCTSCGFATALCVCSDGPRDPETSHTTSAASTRQELQANAERLKALPEDWDSYGSVVIDPETADKAVEIALALAPHFPSYGTPALVPTSDGAVQVECHSDGWNMECYVRRAK